MTHATKKTSALKTLSARLGIGLFLTAAVLAPLSTAKADPAHNYRRTLFISFGQKDIVLEAPVGMCFLDGSDYFQGAFLSLQQGGSSMGKDGKGMAMAVFGDCTDIMNLGTKNQSPTGLKDRGTIVWKTTAANRGKSKLDLSDYLDMREATFLQDQKGVLAKSYASNGAKKEKSMGGGIIAHTYMATPDKYHFDKAVHRTADNVSIAYQYDNEIEFQKFKTTGIVAATLIRHLPIEVYYTHAASPDDKDATGTQDMYKLMDSFMAQQQALNRP